MVNFVLNFNVKLFQNFFKKFPMLWSDRVSRELTLALSLFIPYRFDLLPTLESPDEYCHGIAPVLFYFFPLQILTYLREICTLVLETRIYKPQRGS